MLQSINCAVVSVDVKLIGSIQLWNESQSQLKIILLKLNNYSNSNVNIDAHFHTFIIDSGGHTNQILVDCIGVVSDFDADHVVVKKGKPTTDQDPEVPICSTRNSQVVKQLRWLSY